MATYTLTTQVGRDGTPEILSNTVVPNTVASVTLSGAPGTGAQYVGEALASTFTPLFVQAKGEVDALPGVGKTPTTGETYLSVSSQLSYYFQVVQTAPAPVDVIPLLVNGRGEASASSVLAYSAQGAASATAIFDIPELNILQSAQARCVDPSCPIPPPSMSFTSTDSASVAPGENVQVELQGTGFAVVGEGVLGNSLFQAIVDPVIQIDPSFAYADDFAVVFSPNLTPSAATPEPSSIALLAPGLLALMAVFKWSSSTSLKRIPG